GRRAAAGRAPPQWRPAPHWPRCGASYCLCLILGAWYLQAVGQVAELGRRAGRSGGWAKPWPASPSPPPTWPGNYRAAPAEVLASSAWQSGQVGRCAARCAASGGSGWPSASSGSQSRSSAQAGFEDDKLLAEDIVVLSIRAYQDCCLLLKNQLR
nr:hypothetical protein [Tanacetum cinerariifolium]